MRLRVIFLALSLAMLPRFAHADAAIIEREFQNAQELCGEVENGVVKKGSIKIQPLDLNENDKPDGIVNYAEIECSSSMLAFCGNGGCPIVIYVDGKRHEDFARDVQVVKVFDGFPLLVFSKHGSACGGYGAQGCLSFMYWNGEELVAGTPEFENKTAN